MTKEPRTKGSVSNRAWWVESGAGAPTVDASSTTEATRLTNKESQSKRPARQAKVVVEGEAEGCQPLRCPVCSRANPADAYYCYFDGKPLLPDLQPTHLPVGRVAFPAPFCFSGGQACINFNQLALACNNLWEESRELLTSGIWSVFFASMGRQDLAAVATQAAKDGDPDRGLSTLLEKFPADAEFLRSPKVSIDAREYHLGPLTPGTDYTFELVIRNEGMRLLHGIVVSNFEWLVFENGVKPAPAAPEPVRVQTCAKPANIAEGNINSEKMFQTRHGSAITVRILGSKLRAGVKPLLADIIVDTNGGALTVPVRLEVPIRPYPSGDGGNDILAGVRSPRELALRAKKSPKEVGLLFEQGAVKTWYAGNGWTYPIQGADGQGEGAVQQFFEALGLTEPPQLEVDTRFLTFRGKPGQTHSACITLRTRDAKPVYAQAWSNCDWIKLGPIQYRGARVKVPVEITAPATPGQSATAEVTIQGNGKQQFVVPVAVAANKR